jgi:hypothetical protein
MMDQLGTDRKPVQLRLLWEPIVQLAIVKGEVSGHRELRRLQAEAEDVLGIEKKN